MLGYFIERLSDVYGAVSSYLSRNYFEAQTVPAIPAAKVDRRLNYFLDVPTYEIDSTKSVQQFDLTCIVQQVKLQPKEPHRDIRELRQQVLYDDLSKIISNSDYYQKASLADKYIELLGEDDLLPEEMMCSILFTVNKHPVRIHPDPTVYSFNALHGYLRRAQQLDQHRRVFYTLPKTNERVLGRPSIVTDITTRNTFDKRLNAFFVKLQIRYEKCADEMQCVDFMRARGRLSKLEFPRIFFSSHSKQLMLRPIRISSRAIIDLSEYQNSHGAFCYALDVMKSMEDFCKKNYDMIHPSNFFYCPF